MTRRFRSSRRRAERGFGGQSVELLEPRVVLAADIAVVGFQDEFDSSAGRAVFETYVAEAQIGSDGTFVGEDFESGEFGPVSRGIFETMLNFDAGAGTYGGPIGEDYDNVINALTGPANQAAGWFFGYADGAPDPFFGGGSDNVEFAFWVERPASASLADIQGEWRTAGYDLELDRTEVGVGFNGITTITGDTLVLGATSFTAGESVSESGRIQLLDSQGKFTLDVTGQPEDRSWFYLSSDGNMIIGANLDTADDSLQVYALTRVIDADDGVTAQSIAGMYRTSFGFDQGYVDLGNEDETYADAGVFDLRANGTFTYTSETQGFSADGTWVYDGTAAGTVTITAGSTVVSFYVSPGSNVLLPFVDIDDNGITGLVGMGVKINPAAVAAFGEAPVAGAQGPGGAHVFAVPGVNPSGDPAVYELRADGGWYTSDVAAETDSAPITGAFYSWTDESDGRAYAAAVTDEGLMLYREQANDVWTVRNLTTEIAGADAPVTGSSSVLEYMVTRAGRVHLIAVGVDGDILRYYQDGGTTDSGEARYAFQNITEEELEPAGVSTPAFAGELVAYATSWGALNVVGLDAAGDIQSVWWAPRRPRWSTTNLTSSLGAESLVGGLTVFLTSWNAVNIAGVNTSGDLVATWWVPSVNPQWRQVNLTTSIGAPQLTPESVSSFVAPWGALNVVGADADTGEVLAYWWSPARTGQGWTFTSLSNAVPGSSPALVRDLAGLSSPADNSLNVFGYDASDNLVRYFWYAGEGWQSQDITATAGDGEVVALGRGLRRTFVITTVRCDWLFFLRLAFRVGIRCMLYRVRMPSIE